MRAESWMDHTPPKPDPIKQAKRDLTYWSDRCRSLEQDLTIAHEERSKASDALDRLENQRFK